MVCSSHMSDELWWSMHATRKRSSVTRIDGHPPPISSGWSRKQSRFLSLCATSFGVGADGEHAALPVWPEGHRLCTWA